MLKMGEHEKPVLLTSAQDPSSMTRLFDQLVSFPKDNAATVAQRRKDNQQTTLLALMESIVQSQAQAWIKKQAGGQTNPYGFVEKFLKNNSLKELFPA